MRIAVIGTGGIGLALGGLFARHGHEVVFGSRDPRASGARAQAVGASGALGYRAAAASASLVCFAIAWENAEAVLAQLGDLSGKVVLDPSNPEALDGRSLALGHTRSGAEALADRMPGAHVVKAFNYVYAELLRDDAALARVAPSIFYCGDDSDAKSIVAVLLESCGLAPVDCGGLLQARYLEPLAMLMVHLVREQGWAPEAVAMRFVHAARPRAAAPARDAIA